MTFVDTITQWREDWSPASVVNHTIVTDPTIRQPGFDLPRHTKFEGRLNLLHEADDDAVMWLEATSTAALAK